MDKHQFFEAIEAAEQKGGMKFDSGKPRVHLLLSDFNLAMLEIAKVATFGAAKYADRNWREVENGYERYSDAEMRHYLADSYEGGEIDPESGYLHAAHKAWNAIATLQIILERKKEKENGNG